MSTITIDIPPETYKRLNEMARREGKDPETLGRELLEAALGLHVESQSKSAQEVLREKGRIRPLDDSLRRKIIPSVTLDEVRKTLREAEGPSLSEIILTQRGPRG